MLIYSTCSQLAAETLGRCPLFSIQKHLFINPLSANPTEWSNTLKQFVAKLPTNCLSVLDHFLGLAPKGLNDLSKITKRRNFEH